MRLVSVPFWAIETDFGSSFLSACLSTPSTDRPLMRWAPHSAEISRHGTPHTFAV